MSEEANPLPENPENNPSDDLDAEFNLIESQAEGDPAEALQQEQQQQQQAEQKSQFEKARDEYNGLFQAVLNPTFQVVAPAWGVSQEEIAALAETYAEVAATYYPDGVGQLGPWPGAIMCTAMVVGPRMKMPRHLPPPQEPGQQKQEGAPSDIAER